MVCKAGRQVAGRASSAWGSIGTRWQVPLMVPPREVLCASFWSASTLRFKGPKTRPRTPLPERSRVIIFLGH